MSTMLVQAAVAATQVTIMRFRMLVADAVYGN